MNISAQEHLQRINEEIYKQNAELAVKNKTLSLLRQLYEIATLTLETRELARKLVESIRTILNFSFVGILILDKDTQRLVPFADSASEKTRTQMSPVYAEYEKVAIPLSSQENICAEALRTKKKKQTEKFFDVVAPFLSTSAVSTVQKNSGIQTSLIYPLLTGNKELGVLLLALPRKAKDLSFFEKESIENLVNVVAIALDKAMLYEALEFANARLQKLDKEKSEFVSIASHQLRTPLTAMKGYISMILEGSYGTLETKQKKPLESISESNERLIRLVNDLLNVSRIEAGKVEMKWEQGSAEEIIKSVVEELGIKIKEKKMELVFKEPESSLPLIRMDKEKIRNVVLNIVDNAIRYAPHGNITVNVSAKGGSAAGGKSLSLLIAVKDTGEGMAQEEIGKLFETFSRGGAGMKFSTEGAGLGLYIAKKFVEMHKGRIWAESEGKGKGSTFFVELPLA